MHDRYQLIQLPQRPIPSAIPEDEEIFAIGDVHGRAGALRSCLSNIAARPRTDGVRRTIIFLGDILDRGPASLEAMDLAFRARELARADEVHLLPGNHELMYADAIAGAPSLGLMNGGMDVMDEVDRDWRDLPCADVMHAFRFHGSHPGRAIASQDRRHGVRPCRPLSVRGTGHTSRPSSTACERPPALGLDQAQFPGVVRGWTWEPAASQYGWGNTLVVHGHSPAITRPLAAASSSLAACDVVDPCRRVCLDAGSARMDQIAWAHFFRVEATTMMQISASSIVPQVDLSDLYF